jgi:CrcB protein
MEYDLLYLSVGALLGVFMRYKITSSGLFIGDLPVSVLAVNIIGSLVLGASSAAVASLGLDEGYTLLIGIGFCGCLTTMSSFAYETINLATEGELLMASLDVLMNVGASLGAILLGRVVIILLLGIG